MVGCLSTAVYGCFGCGVCCPGILDDAVFGETVMMYGNEGACWPCKPPCLTDCSRTSSSKVSPGANSSSGSSSTCTSRPANVSSWSSWLQRILCCGTVFVLLPGLDDADKLARFINETRYERLDRSCKYYYLKVPNFYTCTYLTFAFT